MVNNKRVPKCAMVLLIEVQSDWPKATMTATGETDGFNVMRTVRYDGLDGDEVEFALLSLGDPRIVNILNDETAVEVTFAANRAADYLAAFNLPAALIVARGSAAPLPSDDDDGEAGVPALV